MKDPTNAYTLVIKEGQDFYEFQVRLEIDQ
jgi:hypothetical protein